MGKVFGIDLGTTYSCIAYIDDLGKPVTIQNAEEEKTTPSVVYFESPESVVVGKYAKEESILHPYQSVALIKRDMGQTVTRNINGVDMRPEEISAVILKKLVSDATEELRSKNKLDVNEEIRDVVITCPAYFGMAEKEATKTAGELAGLNVMAIINEPTAAAINYGIDEETSNKTVLVYDLGGGTFDVTVIHIEKNTNSADIRVVVTGGNHVLGGADWDRAIVDYVAEKFEEEYGTPKQEILDNPEALQNLTISAESAKKMLSAKEKANISLTYEGDSIRVELTRDIFNDRTQDLLEQTITLTNDTIAKMDKKGYSLNDISEILLVGGSSKMPQVQERIEKEYNIPIRLYDPNEAVAKGAAVYAADLNKYSEMDETNKIIEDFPPSSPTNITDVSSRAYGIGTYNIIKERNEISNIILQNDELPANVTQEFYPINDNQSHLLIKVYESVTDERIILPEMGKQIGENILNLPAGMLHTEMVDVTFKLDNAGLLKMEAVVRKNGERIESSFDVSGSMGKEQKKEAKERMDGLVLS